MGKKVNAYFVFRHWALILIAQSKYSFWINGPLRHELKSETDPPLKILHNKMTRSRHRGDVLRQLHLS